MIRSNFRALFVALFLAGTIAGPAALTGCTLFGVQKPATAAESTVAAYKSVATIADLVGTLNAAGKLTDADANAALDKAQELKKGIDTAIALRNAGDFSNADTRLAATISALELLLAELKARQ
jgi:hypothetical protein